jgi:hypothetical protein
MKEVSVTPRNEKQRIWVFTPYGRYFPAGIWTTRDAAEKWISEVSADGMLSVYILDESAYESNVRFGHLRLDLGKLDRRSAECKRTFTTAVDHFHYEQGRIEGSGGER